jgi:hypothetical protein
LTAVPRLSHTFGTEARSGSRFPVPSLAIRHPYYVKALGENLTIYHAASRGSSLWASVGLEPVEQQPTGLPPMRMPAVGAVAGKEERTLPIRLPCGRFSK